MHRIKSQIFILVLSITLVICKPNVLKANENLGFNCSCIGVKISALVSVVFLCHFANFITINCELLITPIVPIQDIQPLLLPLPKATAALTIASLAQTTHFSSPHEKICLSHSWNGNQAPLHSMLNFFNHEQWTSCGESFRKVMYLNDLERESFLAHVIDGHVFNRNLTSLMTTQFKGDSTTTSADFIVDKVGDLFIANPKKHHLLRHSSLSQGRPVLLAGRLHINASGKITKIDRGSGHYKIPERAFRENFAYFERNGVQLLPGGYKD